MSLFCICFSQSRPRFLHNTGRGIRQFIWDSTRRRLRPSTEQTLLWLQQLIFILSRSMKCFIIFATLLSLGFTQEEPRYSCPEIDVDFNQNDIQGLIPNVASWEDCGMSRQTTRTCFQIIFSTNISRNDLQSNRGLLFLDMGTWSCWWSWCPRMFLEIFRWGLTKESWIY